LPFLNTGVTSASFRSSGKLLLPTTSSFHILVKYGAHSLEAVFKDLAGILFKVPFYFDSKEFTSFKTESESTWSKSKADETVILFLIERRK